MTQTFDLRGLDELEAEIRQWPDVALAAADPAMHEALLYLHGQIPQYPPPPGPDAPSPLRTDKQRRWFFAALREGRIQVPYRRTGDLGRSITTDVESDGESVTGAIGSGLARAPWVVGKDYPGERVRGERMFQASIHSGRWWQFDKVIERESDAADAVFVEEFWREFLKLVER